LSSFQETAISRPQPPRNEEIIDQVIKLVQTVRKHVEKDNCSCCKGILKDV
jgi:hypothetical protein